MRDQWYGDKRDVVKWGTLIHLAKKRQDKRIVHVAYYRPSELEYALETDAGPVQIDPAVIAHFHDIEDVQRLSAASGVHIDIFKYPFEVDRTGYHDLLIHFLSTGEGRQIVFLDPDTGIAPANYDYSHVRADEIRRVYNALHKGDLLVFYQHKRLMQKQWLTETWWAFVGALGVPREETQIITGSGVANDVAFFVASK